MDEVQHRISAEDESAALRAGEDAALAKSGRDVVLDWAKSGGFAAVHGGGATDAKIVDDLLGFLWQKGFKVAPLEERDLER